MEFRTDAARQLADDPAAAAAVRRFVDAISAAGELDEGCVETLRRMLPPVTEGGVEPSAA